MKKTGLELLREPFPDNQISLKPQPLRKDAPKDNCVECGGYHGLPAIHLKYVGHAALTDRLLDADPTWSWEPVAFTDGLPAFDARGGLWIRLTVCGVTRLGYGNAGDSSFKEIGSREKEVIGDALRNAAMRFGAALDLWHKGTLHADDVEKESPKEYIPLPSIKKPLSESKVDKTDLIIIPEGVNIKSTAGQYKITCKAFAGQLLQDVDHDSIQKYIADRKFYAKRDNKSIAADVLELEKAFNEYWSGNTPTPKVVQDYFEPPPFKDEPWPTEDDEVPF